MIPRLLSSSLLILFSVYCLENTTSALGLSNVTDREALLAIKDLITVDPYEALSSWNNSLHFCSWPGVRCGRKLQRVTSLNLSSLQLAGSLSPNIGNLTFLRVIDLSTNNFHGSIPQEVIRLFRLRFLSLDYNYFQDELPTNLSHCLNLRVVNVGRNNLRGNIPGELASLPHLYELDFLQNHFTGSIPPAFGNLSVLKLLVLGDNNLKGSIPIELGSLSKLEVLDLADNKLSGMFPEQICNISSVKFISIAANQFRGHLPLDLGLTLPNLRALILAENQFSGPIPTSIANASRIEDLNLSWNTLTGFIPKNLGNLQNLLYIDFGGNPLGDGNGTNLTFLTSLANCTNIRGISFYGNHLTGVLPNSIANLSTSLQWLSLQSNNITGAIPAEIGNLKNLWFLALSHNKLTGRLPESIGMLSQLRKFSVHRNKISGKIPSSLGNISGLLRLNLGDNLLEGTIPVSLSNCIHLTELLLARNYLSGFIPEQIFFLSSTIILRLNSNNLTGNLPSQVGNMTNLIKLDFSKNKLSGEIPSTIENCVMLESLKMKGNFFEGTIPSSIKKLRSIRVLDLSRNGLSGQIPEFLGELPLLENLNLSFNEFEGELPTEGVFKNASAFSVAGNHKLCGGIDAIQLLACPKMGQQNWIVAIPLGSVALFIVLLLAILKRLPKTVSALASAVPPLGTNYLKVTYADIIHATDGFSSANMVGDGSYGTVYKGTFKSDDQIVTVKVLKLHQQGAKKSFLAECEALRQVRHRNLVRIITACSSTDFKGSEFKALIFEFYLNGSLESWLHPIPVEVQDSKRLGLMQRINIVIDVASALDYLHNHCENPIVHCDLKPSNILLDNDLTACVADFGLARILSAATGESLSTSTSSFGIRGTIGYVATEYGMGGEVSIHGDVYSFGVLLLEMFTGRRPTDSMFTGNLNLHNFVKSKLPDQVSDIVDPLLTIDIQEALESNRTGNMRKIRSCLTAIFRVGVLCSADLPNERMVIEDALSELDKIRNTLSSK